MRKTPWILLGLVVLGSSCAYRAADQAPKSPSGGASASPDEALAELDRAEHEVASALGQTQQGFATAPMQPGAAPPPPPPAETSPSEDKAPTKKKEMREEVDAARSSSEGGGACETACKALDSMRRASGHLCDLTGESDTRCDDAKSRLRSAEERVRASCHACS